MCMLIFTPALAIENLMGNLLGFVLISWAVWAGIGFLLRRKREPKDSVPFSPIDQPSKAVSGIVVPDIGLLPHPEPEHQQVLKPSDKVSLWIVVPICAVLGWTALLVFHRYGFSAEMAGYWIGTLLVPFLIAYAIAGTRRRRNWGRFSIWFFALGIILSGASNQKSLASLSHADLLKELIGSKPLEENLPENEREMARATKAFFDDMKAFRKSHDEQSDALAPDLALLYTAESFSSKAVMQRTLDTVDKQLELDLKASEMLKRIPEMAKNRIDQSSLSINERQDFMTGVMKSFNGSEYLSARQQAMNAESDWVHSADDLYSFAIQHASKIIVNKGKISTASDTLREQFNRKLTGSEGLLDKYLTSAKKADDIQAANQKSAGISDADLGKNK